MKQETIYIYGLVDPRTDEVRYIGKTNNPKRRLQCHIDRARQRVSNNHKNNWIRKLLSLGMRPQIKVLRICTPDNWAQAEIELIAEARSKGVRLTNILKGGTQPPTWDEIQDPEKRKRQIAESNRRRKPPNKGRKWSKEIKLKVSKALSGKNNPMYGLRGENHPAYGREILEITRQRLSEALTGEKNPMYGKTHTEEARKKMSLARKGKRPTKKTRFKRSLSCKMYHAKKKGLNEKVLDLQVEYFDNFGEYHPKYECPG